MYELIQRNQRKSLILFFSMGICLVFLGYVIGAAVINSEQPGLTGAFIAFAIWIILSLISYFSGDSILLSVSHATEISCDTYPKLYNIVEEMKIASNLSKIPRIFIIPDEAPNAFATGRRPDLSCIAVTSGLLSRLNRDELQGVIAHETAHIVNRDILFMTFAGMMMGSIVLISDVFIRGLWYSGGSSKRYRSNNSKNNQGAAIFFLIAIVFSIIAPILAQVLYFAISRKREYLADACGVKFTRYPEGLASALEKISSSEVILKAANKVTAPMYIVNPLKGGSSGLSDLSSTHPPISERIKILRCLTQGASIKNYQHAYEQVKGTSSRIIPLSELAGSEQISIRTSSPAETPEKDIINTREVGDLIRAHSGYVFISCSCGLKFKVPGDFKETSITCPKCGLRHTLPSTAAILQAAQINSILQPNAPKAHTGEEISYTKKSEGWETVTCECGRLHNISPNFTGKHIFCNNCGRKINIINKSA
ncbi:MAG: M48 family metallopeptidase [Bacillota bacterium]|nr:M48 family metallopeptidase [Bacillota bacterium]